MKYLSLRFVKLERVFLAALVALFVFGPSSHYSSYAASSSPARLKAIERYVGLHEVKNRKRIQSIIGVNPRRTPWCGAAVAMAVKTAGGTPPKGHLKASRWMKFGSGVSLSKARKGDVVVFRFKRGYHVAIYKRRLKNGRVEACGGNMSNRFKCSAYRANSVRAVRR